jgi:hypothetical protein
MEKQKQSFTMAMMKYFGRKEGQSLKDFAEELKAGVGKGILPQH